MKSFKTALFAALVVASDAAMADTSVVNMDNISQSQSGSRNKQSLELATVDGGAISGPVVGVASSISKLISKLIQFGRDLKEVKAANKQLLTGPWNLTQICGAATACHR